MPPWYIPLSQCLLCGLLVVSWVYVVLTQWLWIPQGQILWPVHFCITNDCYSPWHKVGFQWILNETVAHLGFRSEVGQALKMWWCWMLTFFWCLEGVLEGSPSLEDPKSPPFHNAQVVVLNCTKNFCRKVWHGLCSLLAQFWGSHSICSSLPLREKALSEQGELGEGI